MANAEQKFPCRDAACDKEYTCSENVGRHWRVKHGNCEDKFVCWDPNCDYSTNRSDNFTRHLKGKDHRLEGADLRAAHSASDRRPGRGARPVAQAPVAAPLAQAGPLPPLPFVAPVFAPVVAAPILDGEVAGINNGLGVGDNPFAGFFQDQFGAGLAQGVLPAQQDFAWDPVGGFQAQFGGDWRQGFPLAQQGVLPAQEGFYPAVAEQQLEYDGVDFDNAGANLAIDPMLRALDPEARTPEQMEADLAADLERYMDLDYAEN